MAGKPENTGKKTSIGGQALIEGVMMRGPKVTAMAVRHVSGEIVMEQWATSGQSKPRVWKTPFLRGIYNMIDSMRFGYKCLMRSAELAGFEDEEPKKKVTAMDELSAGPGPDAEEAVPPGPARTGLEPEEPVSDIGEESASPVPGPETTALPDPAVQPAAGETAKEEETPRGWFEKFGMTLLMTLSAVIGVALAVGLFLYLPSFLYRWIAGLLDSANGWNLAGNSFLRGVCEGVLRLILFIGYLLLVTLMKDMRRVFMYHGAEHKTIFCYESGEELTVENVRKQKRFHPRCGTSFLVLMLLIGIVVSICIQIETVWLRVLIKIAVLPLIVGVGYELIKLAGRKDNAFTRAISAPGLWMQRITTKEPDDSMIECAIAALKPVIPENPDEDKW